MTLLCLLDVADGTRLKPSGWYRTSGAAVPLGNRQARPPRVELRYSAQAPFGWRPNGAADAA
jgi:hypothetical protein